jgi:Cu2+-containing amine oxidase
MATSPAHCGVDEDVPPTTYQPALHGLQAGQFRPNRPVRDTDIVIWHTFVAHHVVRPEDWPVMPVTTAGFQLRPFGYFDSNPALDLPRPQADHCSRPG